MCSAYREAAAFPNDGIGALRGHFRSAVGVARLPNNSERRQHSHATGSAAPLDNRESLRPV
jgi:hypothetical protein